jgi:16S rRNA (cytosine967-C5)-methyltransferase
MSEERILRLYRPLCEAVIEGLGAVFIDGRYADKVVTELLKADKRRGSRDRAFIASHIYEIVRWKRKLVWLGGLEDRPDSPTKFWLMLGIYLLIEGHDLMDWEEWAELDDVAVETKWNQLADQSIAIRESYDDWMNEKLSAAFGDKWPELAVFLNYKAPLTIRRNTLAPESVDLEDILADWGPEPSSIAPDALVLETRGNIFGHPAFKEGLFEIQDAGSQCISTFLRVEPGMRVVDACAGAGGKSLHLAALTANKGRIISLDIEEYKLEELKKRARRGHISNIETRVITTNKIIKRLYGSADRLLLDVPCSGLGVLRRNPDAKWKMTEARLAELIETQAKILSGYAPILKVGGLLVYATCSLLREENEAQVEKFLAEHGENYRLVEQKTISPVEHNADGFYMALIERIA